MNYINVYLRVLKNKKNYNLIFYNLNHNILLFLNLNYSKYMYYNYNLYIKLIKKFLLENGLKIVLVEN